MAPHVLEHRIIVDGTESEAVVMEAVRLVFPAP
jgi:RNA binding exosome subunit